MPSRPLPFLRATGIALGLLAAGMPLAAGEPMPPAPRAWTEAGLARETELSSLDSTPEFRGVMTLGSVVSVALAVPPEAPARWFPVGAHVGRYVIVGFEPGRDLVVLASPAGNLRLALKKPRVASAWIDNSASADPASSSGVVMRMRENLTQLAIAAAHYWRASARSEVTVADLVGPGRMIDALRPVAGEDYSLLHLTRTAVMLSVALADGTTVTLEPAAVASAASRYHLVGSGDTLAGLAHRAGQPLGALLELNELAAPDDVPRVGRLLRLR